MWALPRTAAVVLAAALLAGGCGGEPAPTPEEQVRSTLREFGRATAAKDYRALCTRVLAPELIADVVAQGLPCEQALAKGLASRKDPRISVGRVTVRDAGATAEAVSSAVGEEPSRDTIELVRVGGGWRISSLQDGGG